MSTFRVDITAFQRAGLALGALDRKQLPFALAGALNASAEIGRRTLIEDTWPSHVEARDPNFLKNALTIKGERATKRRLRVVVYDKFGRAHLRAHEVGGTKMPRGKAIAIPVEDIAAKRTARGMPQRLKPRALPDSFVTDGRRLNPHLKQGAVYQRQGAYRAKGTTISRTGKKRKEAADFRTVKLAYVLKPSAPIRATVPFHADFERSIRRTFPREFRVAMRRAMSTALRK